MVEAACATEPKKFRGESLACRKANRDADPAADNRHYELRSCKNLEMRLRVSRIDEPSKFVLAIRRERGAVHLAIVSQRAEGLGGASS